MVGWFASKRMGDQADRENGPIHIPYATFRSLFPSMGDGPGWFSLTALPDVAGSELESEVKGILRARHEAAPDDEMAIGSFNTEEEFGKMRRIFAAIRGITWFVGVATLLSGVVGVSNILLITVRERTAEIGMRRAVGATPGAIISSIVEGGDGADRRERLRRRRVGGDPARDRRPLRRATIRRCSPGRRSTSPS